MENPCRKDCPERTATCHCTCMKYKQFRAYKDEQIARKNQLIQDRPLSHDLEMKYRKKLKNGKKGRK